ncbi:hypothetical protein GGI43DRAFT_383913 [Trichoderma evansii]
MAASEYERCNISHTQFRDNTVIHQGNVSIVHLNLPHPPARARIVSVPPPCLRHLNATDPSLDKQRIEETKGGLLEDSYRWVLDNGGFLKWRDSLRGQMLWVKGDPGKGKTMLLCGIINELTKSKSTNLSYFFCQATDSRLNNASAVLRGLIYMLVSQNPKLESHVQKRYGPAGEQLFECVNAWTALAEILTNILRDENLQHAYLIIDALDECGTAEIGGANDELSKLLNFIVLNSALQNVYWLVSSRNLPIIEGKFSAASQKEQLSLELNQDSISKAVGKYIEWKVSELAREKQYNEDIRAAVQRHLSSNAHDTFLWVALVCQELGRTTLLDTLSKLKAFPPGLDPLYGRMRSQISDSENAILCKHTLAVATAVYRPITLDELRCLIDIPDYFSDDQSLIQIVGLCGSFLTIRERTIFFVHQSAKEYVSMNWMVLHFGPTNIHHKILSRSLQAMSRTLKPDIYQLGHPGYPIDKVEQPDKDPLSAVRYSCVYWIDHLLETYQLGHPGYPIDKVEQPDKDPLSAVRDSCVYWIDHLLEAYRSTFFTFNISRDPSSLAGAWCPGDLCDGGKVHIFLQESLLKWLEALSLLRSVSNGVLAIGKLESLLTEYSKDSRLSKFVRDVHRLIQYHKRAIENNPLQVYASALVFSPTCSITRNYFKGDWPEWISKNPAMENGWGACLQTLEGHGTSVRSVAWSYNATRLASGSDNGMVIIWDPATGRCVSTLKHLDGSVMSVAWSHDAKRLASASDGKTIKIWDVATGCCISTLEGHGGWIMSMVWSHDAKSLMSASCDNTVKVWDPATGSCETHEGHGDEVSSVGWSPDTMRLATALECGTVKIWNLSTTPPECTLEFKCHDKSVRSVAWSHNATLLASASEDTTIKIWDLATGQCVSMLEGHQDSVGSVAWSHNAKRLASASEDKTVKIWDLATSQCILTLKGHCDYVKSVAWSHNTARLASASDDNTVKIWDLATSPCILTLEGHKASVRSLAWSHNATQLASAADDNTIKIWDLATDQCLSMLEGHQDSVGSVAWSHNAKQLASASNDKTVKIWDPKTGLCLSTLEGHHDSVISVAWSHNATLLASSSIDKTVKIWDLETGLCLSTLEGHQDSVGSVAWSYNAKQLASASNDKTVKIWDPKTGLCLSTLEGHHDSVISVAWSHDATFLASASNDRTVKIWDPATGQYLSMLEDDIGIDNLQFHKSNSNILYTNRGTFDLRSDQNSTHHFCLLPTFGYGLSSDNTWITYRGENLLWLPPEYRPSCSAISERAVSIGCSSGRVLMLTFSDSNEIL